MNQLTTLLDKECGCMVLFGMLQGTCCFERKWQNLISQKVLEKTIIPSSSIPRGKQIVPLLQVSFSLLIAWIQRLCFLPQRREGAAGSIRPIRQQATQAVLGTLWMCPPCCRYDNYALIAPVFSKVCFQTWKTFWILVWRLKTQSRE